jgi:hypothetical protein
MSDDNDVQNYNNELISYNNYCVHCINLLAVSAHSAAAAVPHE